MFAVPKPVKRGGSTIDPLIGSEFASKVSSPSAEAAATAVARASQVAAADEFSPSTSCSSSTPSTQPTPSPQLIGFRLAAQTPNFGRFAGMEMTSASHHPLLMRNSYLPSAHHQQSVSSDVGAWGMPQTALPASIISTELLLSLANPSGNSHAPMSPFFEATKALQMTATASMQQGASPQTSDLRKLSAEQVVGLAGLSALEFAQQLASHKASPMMLPPKNEPSSSSNSQPGTPSQMVYDRRAVPACAICGTDSTGIHFGVDACAACSAFFRRTVVLDKKYTCNKDGRCIVLKDGSAGQKCRACRFRKCINAGMDRTAVQHRRDAIGKYSAGVKRDASPELDVEPSSKVHALTSHLLHDAAVAAPSSSSSFLASSSSTAAAALASSSAPSSSSETLAARLQAMAGMLHQPMTTTVAAGRTPSPPPRSILQELLARQRVLLEQRQLFYASTSLSELFRTGPAPAMAVEPIHELTNFNECMYHLWRIEPRLAADFINKNRYLAAVDTEEKIKIYKNFVVVRQAVEEPFLTWRHGGLERQWFVMPNRTYIDFTDPSKYFNNGALKDLKLDMHTAKNLFMPSFLSAMETVGKMMQNINLTDVELVILLGLVLLDPATPNLREDTRHLLSGLRDQLVQDIFMMYDNDETSLESPEIRIADLFMVVAAIKVHAMKTSENMHILRVFDLIAPDPIFSQMLDSDAQAADADMNQQPASSSAGSSSSFAAPPTAMSTASSSPEMKFSPPAMSPMNATATATPTVIGVAYPSSADVIFSSPTTTTTTSAPELLQRMTSECDSNADVDVVE